MPKSGEPLIINNTHVHLCSGRKRPHGGAFAQEDSVHIAFVVNNYPPRTGGVELHVQALGRELSRRGHRVTVVTLGRETGWGNDGTISVLTLSERGRVADVLGFPLPGTRRKLTPMLRKQGIDVVSVHTRFFPMSFVGWRAARSARIPVIHTEHGSGHVASGSAAIRLASRAVDFTLSRMVLRGADRVLGVSEEVVAFVKRLSGIEATVFYNAISEPHHSTEVARRASHLVFVGRIVPGKGWESYLEAVGALHESGHDVTGAVLGDGAELPQLLERLREMGLEDSVSVRGRVSQDAVRAELRGATLVNPTVLSEGFQTTLLEAIVEGGSVVTYPVAGARTLTDSGAPVTVTARRDSGALVDALVAHLGMPPAPAAAGFIKAWTWPTRAAEYERIIETVLAGHTRGRI